MLRFIFYNDNICFIIGPRVSGVALILLEKKLRKSLNLLLPEIPVPRMATLRKINNINTSELIDEGYNYMVSGPESYTGEDMAEIHIHGGKAVDFSSTK